MTCRKKKDLNDSVLWPLWFFFNLFLRDKETYQQLKDKPLLHSGDQSTDL